jgi:hypothetical protein
LLYAVAASTGYRAGELAVLVPESFRLDSSPPTIDLSGGFTKTGKDASQPIPVELADTLRGFLGSRPAGEPVRGGMWSGRSAEMLQADAAAAGLVLEIQTKDGV